MMKSLTDPFVDPRSFNYTNFSTGVVPFVPTPLKVVNSNQPNITINKLAFPPLDKRAIGQLKDKMLIFLKTPSALGFYFLASRMIRKFDVARFIVLLVLIKNESDWNGTATNGTANGFLQLLRSNLSRINEAVTRKFNDYKPLLTDFANKFKGFDPVDLGALKKGGFNFVEQALHPLIQLIPGMILFRDNLETIGGNFRYTKASGWTLRGSVINQNVHDLFKQYAPQFLDHDQGLMLLMTLLHINGAPILKNNNALSYPERFVKDLRAYQAIRDTTAFDLITKFKQLNLKYLI